MAINYKKGIKTFLEHLGSNNNPAYIVVAIATAKGIFRPLFTMMDKKESSETKKYTALREGLTEVIAIPTYILCGTIAGKGAELIKDAEKAKMAKHNLRFVGVCTAALVVIPGLCSLVVKPFTDKIFNKNSEKRQPSQLQHFDVISGSKPPVFQKFSAPTAIHNYPARRISMSTFTNSGMKVG